MPFYEYQCKNCGHHLEAMQKINDSPLKKCPECGKSQLTRLMSAPVFRLKGSGWYETDFKGDQDQKKNLADKPDADAPKDEKKAEGDAKADAKADAKTDKADAKGDGKADSKEGAKDTAKPDKAEKSSDKSADKPAAKSSGDAAKKPSVPVMSKRGATAKAKPTKTAKKPAAKAKRRR